MQKQITKKNKEDWEQRKSLHPHIVVEPPVSEYDKMQAFNYELSSEQITVERVLGMLVRSWHIVEGNTI
jgi:hypothetical protein